MWTKGLWTVCVSLALLGFLGIVRAGETAKEGEPAKDQPTKGEAKEDKEAKPTETKSRPIAKEDAVAKVDDIVLGRADLEGARQFFALTNPQVALSGKQVLEQVINRILWSKYFEKHNLRPTQAELQQAVAQMDQELKNRGSSYQQWLAGQRLKVEDHLGILSYDLAMRKLVADIQSKIKPEETKAEFDAHPEWYDGSKVRLSMAFVDTSNIGHDPKEMDKAKARIEQLYTKVSAPGADFDRIASDNSVGGGDRGLFVRKGADVDEPLMAAAWNLKVGEITKPVQGARGWYILKVADREPPALTPHGGKQAVLNELTRKRLEAQLDELKAAAKIETYL
jgi:parvulin-like peptidyl-prolyl isomerase